MHSPLIRIDFPSIYFSAGIRALLPRKMAVCTPDTRDAISRLQKSVQQRGGELYLSDLYRSHDMQLQSHLDWQAKRKVAFSPPPGGSLHEAGRSIDLDLDALKMPLADFWPLAKAEGFSPIIATPSSQLSEAWHFDHRGSHHLVYEHYVAGRGRNLKPYAAMAASAILSTGVIVDRFADNQREATIQCGLVRLGFDIGSIDGELGAKSFAALDSAGLHKSDLDATLTAVEDALQAAFPPEFEETAGPDDFVAPSHVIQ
jgi:hypothetical protein